MPSRETLNPSACARSFPVQERHRLVKDNLMDLTHKTFVHGSNIGNREIGLWARRLIDSLVARENTPVPAVFPPQAAA